MAHGWESPYCVASVNHLGCVVTDSIVVFSYRKVETRQRWKWQKMKCHMKQELRDKDLNVSVNAAVQKSTVCCRRTGSSGELNKRKMDEDFLKGYGLVLYRNSMFCYFNVIVQQC